jgi:hypothetical protein
MWEETVCQLWLPICHPPLVSYSTLRYEISTNLWQFSMLSIVSTSLHCELWNQLFMQNSNKVVCTSGAFEIEVIEI